MDINDFRAWTILVLIITFVLIVVWAYSKKRNKDFSEAANLPFTEPEQLSSESKHHRGVQ